MNFCPYCGKGIRVEANFCPYCGSNIIVEKPDPEPEPEPEAEQTYEEPVQEEPMPEVDEMTRKKLFLQLQFSMLMLACSMLPDFGNLVSELLGFGGLSFAVIIARLAGLVFGGLAFYNYYQAVGGRIDNLFYGTVGGGMLLTLASLIPGIPSWFDYIVMAVLFAGMYVCKNCLQVEWKSLGSQGAYLILLACLLHLYHNIDPKISTAIAAIVGFIVYLVGLSKLKGGLDDVGRKGVVRLQIAIALGIVSALFGIIPLLGLVLGGIFGLAGLVFEFLGYTSLMKSDPLHDEGREGARKLRLSMILLIVATFFSFFPLTGIIVAIITICALWFVYQGWTKILFGLEA